VRTWEDLPRNKRVYYDKKKFGTPFQEGELVWLFVPYKKKSLSPKLQTFWEGPYKVTKKINDLLYRIQRKRKQKVVHFNRLKRFIGRDSVDATREGQCTVRAPIDCTDSDPESETEDVEHDVQKSVGVMDSSPAPVDPLEVGVDQLASASDGDTLEALSSGPSGNSRSGGVLVKSQMKSPGHQLSPGVQSIPEVPQLRRSNRKINKPPRYQ
jgi:hypothetical protein